MNFQQLRYARAVADTRSFSKAAAQCYVSQPSLSVAIAALEQELGGQLFDRSTRSVTLTPLGEFMAPVIEDALNGLDQVAIAAARFGESSSGLVRLGLSPLIDSRLLKNVIEPFERNQPRHKVILKECMLGDLSQRLASHKIDFACTLQAPGGSKKANSSCPFYTEPLLYLPQQGVSMGSIGPVRVSELKDQTFVLTVDGCGLANATRRLFEKGRTRLKEYPGHALSYDVLEEWVDLGIGSAILPDSKVKSLRKAARPLLQHNGQPATLSYELCWNPKRELTGAPAAFARHFRAVAANLSRGAHKKAAG